MSEQSTINETAAGQITQQVIGAWAQQNKRVTDFFDKQGDEAYLKQVAPGRNRAIYLLGHLIAVSDGMLPLLGLGDRLYPELEAMYVTGADNPSADTASLADLKQKWEKVNTTLAGYFGEMQPHEWLERHTKVSEEDFAKEPLRNKLSILLSRTNHQSYHIGQLVFLNPKN